jgi:STAS domain
MKKSARAAAKRSPRRRPAAQPKHQVSAKRARLATALRALMRQDSDSAPPQQVIGDHAATPHASTLFEALPRSAKGTLPAQRPGMESAFELPATFDATTVRSVHASLIALTQDGGEVRLDGSKVEVADAAAAQLLAALARVGGVVKVKVSPVLSDVLTVTAVGPLLSLEQ